MGKNNAVKIVLWIKHFRIKILNSKLQWLVVRAKNNQTDTILVENVVEIMDICRIGEIAFTPDICRIYHDE